MLVLIQNHSGKILGISVLFFIGTLIWLNSERGEPTGVRLITYDEDIRGQAEFDLLQDAIPIEWRKPDLSPPHYEIVVSVNRVKYDVCHESISQYGTTLSETLLYDGYSSGYYR